MTLALVGLGVGCLNLHGSYVFAGADAGADDAGSADGGSPACSMTCEAKANSCLDARTLLVTRLHACSDSVCQYEATQVACLSGCAAGHCTGEPCAGVVCVAPPAPKCVTSGSLQVFSEVGACINGQCGYASTTVTCRSGCVDDRCVSELCAGVSCRSPPVSACVDSKTLKRFNSLGTCTESTGACQYESTLVTCEQGCVDGACRANPCAGLSCTTPPSAQCRDGVTRTVYANPGVCGASGACDYGATDVACDAGTSCQGGACIADSASCNASNCAGCCVNDRCVLTAAQSHDECGSSGAVCVACEVNSSCLAGACQPVAVDACAVNNGGCDANANCRALDGGVGRSCACKPGYTGDGVVCGADRGWAERDPPAARNGPGFAADSVRHRLVLFGGSSADLGGTDLADTWEWDGTSWEQKFPAVAPSARSYHAMAYDSARGKTVLFGGFTAAGYSAETWEWDGTTWEQRVGAGPPARAVAAMAFDPVKQQLVLFGGLDLSGDRNDTWLLDGVGWVKAAPANSPSSRSGHSMAYDGAKKRVVAFGGGSGSTTFYNSLWEWDGATWVMRTTTGAPSARSEATLVFDQQRQVLVVSGGQTAVATWSLQTWELNGTTWSNVVKAPGTGPGRAAYDAVGQRVMLWLGNTLWQLESTGWLSRTPRPRARSSAAFAFDSKRGQSVLFGGVRSGSLLGAETWLWSGSTWQRFEGAMPPDRADAAFAYDSTRDRAVLFGGWNDSNLNDTWEWDGSAWVWRDIAGPSPRYGHAAVYDEARHVVVLFGGNNDNRLFGETWVFDGATWAHVTSAGAPPARFGHALAYDRRRQRVVLFGGSAASTTLSDTWEWDGTVWAQRDVTGPSNRVGHSMVYDASRARVVLFGGSVGATTFGDTWEWDGVVWSQKSTQGPEERASGSAVFDSARNRLVLFGGRKGTSCSESAGGCSYDDLWER